MVNLISGLTYPCKRGLTVVLSRHSITLLLISILVASCGTGDDGVGLDDGLGEEPPTPPPLEGVDAKHLVASFPQVPIKEGEFWVRPGSVSNIVKKQQPEVVPEAEPAELPIAGAESPVAQEAEGQAPVPADEQSPPADGRNAANEQLVAEHAAPSAPPPAGAEPRRTQRESTTSPSATTTRAERDHPTRANPPDPISPGTNRQPVRERVAEVAKIEGVAEVTKREAPGASGSDALTVTKPVEPARSERESNNLSVAKAALATKIDNRQPVGVSDSFAEGTRVYLFNTILNPSGQSILIHHKWYRGEERVTSIKLSIKAARWRTWSVIPVYGKGPWRVDIVEPSGRVIHTEKFTVN